MLTSGDVVHVDLGTPARREAGFVRPAVVVTAQAILEAEPSVVHVVPFTTTLREFGSEVEIEPNSSNGLTATSAAQCQHVRSISSTRIDGVVGNVGSSVLARIRELLGVIFDIPPTRS